MADNDIVTKLVIHGGAQFVATMSKAAIAEQRLIDNLSKASSLAPVQLGASFHEAAVAILDADKAIGEFKGANEEAAKVAESLVRIINNQSKALAENARAIEEVNRVRRNRPRLIREAGERFEQDVRNSQDAAARIQALNQASIRAEEMLDKQREILARRQRVRQNALVNGQAAANRLISERSRFGLVGTTIAPVVTSATNRAANTTESLDRIAASTTRVTTESEKKNKVLKTQGEVEEQASRKGITYLSTLSAIHAASFLLTNRTFTLLGSFLTLGAAFKRMGLGAQLLGVTLGGAFAAFNVISTGLERVITLAQGIAGVFVGIGAAIATSIGAITVAGAKLASGVEDVFAEIAAFGEPTREQFGRLDEQVSTLSRTFGLSGADVATAASLYIRAGGDAEKALDGATEAVVRLQVASRGELIPAQAARTVTTVTNAFKVGADEAANAVVGLAQKSALSFTEVNQAFQQAGPLASAFNIPLLELSTTMAILANNGLRGTVAGTGFKQVLLDLLNPSKQADEKLRALGLSAFDSNGNIRPLRDTFADLARVLGPEAALINQTGDAMRGQAIAAIFGSRANLAASIIAKSTTAAYDEMLEALGNVDAIEVVNTLLSTTSAQFGITKTNAEALATALGGPLNVAVGVQIKQFNEFIKTISRRPFEAVAQGILAVVSGGGFSAINQDLIDLISTQPRLTNFFIQLLNSALTVRNAFVSQFIPAIESAANTIGTAFGRVNIEGTFNGITRGILGVISAGTTLTGFLATLISDFVTGNERGQTLRNTVLGLATGVGTTLVGALVAAALPMIVAVKLLEAIGKAMLDILDTQNNFNNLWEVGWQLSKNSVNNFLKEVAPGFQAFLQMVSELPNVLSGDTAAIGRATAAFERFNQAQNGMSSSASLAIAQSGNLDKALLGVSNSVITIQRELNNAQNLVDETISRGLAVPQNLQNSLERLQAAEKAALITLHDLQTVKTAKLPESAVQQAIEVARQQLESIRTTPISIDSIFNFEEGDIPTGLTNLSNRLREIQDSFSRDGSDTEPLSTSGAFLPQPEEVDKTLNTILNIQRDAIRELANLEADSAEKRLEQDKAVLERIIDNRRTFDRQIARIDEETARKREEALEQTAEGREFRDAGTRLTQVFDDIESGHERFTQRRDLLEQQSLASSERLIQRRIQDEEHGLSIREQGEERHYSIMQSLQERAFARAQSLQDRQFSRQQSNQEDAFSKQLNREATLRDAQRRLAEAKTPQERVDVQKDLNRAAQDTAFAESQERRLKAFRISQEDDRIRFSESQDDKSFNFRLQQQISETNNRIKLENKFQKIRRGMEDQEFQRRAVQELALLTIRLDRADDETVRRRALAISLLGFQDQLADQQQQRGFRRDERAAQTRKTELAQTTLEQIFEILEGADRQRINQLTQQERQARNIQQRAQERGDTLIEQLGRTPAELITALALINLATDEITASFLEAKAASDRLFDGIGAGTVNQIAREFPGVDVTRAQPTLPLQGAFQVPGNLPTAIRNGIPLILPGNFSELLGRGIAEGFSRQRELTRPNQVTIQGNVFSQDDFINQIQRLLFGQAVQRR